MGLHTHHLLERSLGVAGEFGEELVVILAAVSIVCVVGVGNNPAHFVGAGHAEEGGRKELALFVVEANYQVAGFGRGILLGRHVSDFEDGVEYGT